MRRWPQFAKDGGCCSKVVQTTAGRAWLLGLDETTRRAWIAANRCHRRNGDYRQRDSAQRVQALGPRIEAAAIVTGAEVRGRLVAGWLEEFARCDVSAVVAAARAVEQSRRYEPPKRKAVVNVMRFTQLPVESKPYMERMLAIAGKVRPPSLGGAAARQGVA